MTVGGFVYSILPRLRPCKRRRFCQTRATTFVRRIKPPVFASVLILFFLLHLHQSYNLYYITVSTNPPRTSFINRSLSFSPPPAPIPTLYARHNELWPNPELWVSNASYVLTEWQSEHRYLVSSTGRTIVDDLAKHFLNVNYEVQLAHFLNLTYLYGGARSKSTNTFSRDVVDRFFGWTADNLQETRHTLLRKICEKKGHRHVRNGCNENTMFCKRLVRGNGLVEHLVEIPVGVAECFKLSRDSLECRDAVASFVNENSKPHTLFYTPTSLCSSMLALSDQRLAQSWFLEKYWSSRRSNRLDPRFVNIAVHIHRSNFLRHGRQDSILDATYARVIRKIVSVVSEEELQDVVGSEREPVDLKFMIHIYSQGLFEPQTSHPIVRLLARRGFLRWRSVNDYNTKYVSEEGVEVPDGYWENLLGNMSRINCDLHVSEDTLQGLEQMIAADIFVGSNSPLSEHVAGQLSRGIPFVFERPSQSWLTSRMIRWDPFADRSSESSGGESVVSYFNVEQFRNVWREYRQHIGTAKTPLGIPVRSRLTR